MILSTMILSVSRFHCSIILPLNHFAFFVTFRGSSHLRAKWLDKFLWLYTYGVSYKPDHRFEAPRIPGGRDSGITTLRLPTLRPLTLRPLTLHRSNTSSIQHFVALRQLTDRSPNRAPYSIRLSFSTSGSGTVG